MKKAYYITGTPVADTDVQFRLSGVVGDVMVVSGAISWRSYRRDEPSSPHLDFEVSEGDFDERLITAIKTDMIHYLYKFFQDNGHSLLFKFSQNSSYCRIINTGTDDSPVLTPVQVNTGENDSVQSVLEC